MKARVEPSGLELTVAAGDTLFAAAAAAGARWPNVCGGHAQCRTCWFQLLDGTLEPPGIVESDALRLLAPTVAGEVRLACQARVLGDVRVRKIGVRPPGA